MCYIIVVLFCIFIILHSSLEVHYFLRVCLSTILAKFFKKSIHISDETSITGICIPTDVDALLYHMNNARYLRELDFVRYDFYIRTGLLQIINSEKGSIFQGATTIKYRRFIRCFSVYHIVSKIIFWDEKSIYMEHRFISRKENFICAIVLSKQRVTNVNVEKLMNKILISSKKYSDRENANIQKPNMPPELAKWIECNDISSTNLRNNVSQ